jgi:endonuclease YncB( thermonuclease family)
MRALAFSLLILSPGPVLADYSGRVIHVHDGDSLTLLDHGKKVRLRLAGIDAPELAQPYGWKSLRSLSKICRGKEASAVERGKDDDGRILAAVTCVGEGGEKTDANAEQVKKGLAWVFRTYLPLGSPLYEFETSARLLQKGLWKDKDPVPPWEWRKQHAAKQ